MGWPKVSDWYVSVAILKLIRLLISHPSLHGCMHLSYVLYADVGTRKQTQKERLCWQPRKTVRKNCQNVQSFLWCLNSFVSVLFVLFSILWCLKCNINADKIFLGLDHILLLFFVLKGLVYFYMRLVKFSMFWSGSCFCSLFQVGSE